MTKIWVEQKINKWCYWITKMNKKILPNKRKRALYMEPMLMKKWTEDILNNTSDV